MFCTLINVALEIKRKHSPIYPIMHLLKYISDANDKP